MAKRSEHVTPRRAASDERQADCGYIRRAFARMKKTLPEHADYLELQLTTILRKLGWRPVLIGKRPGGL